MGTDTRNQLRTAKELKISCVLTPVASCKKINRDLKLTHEGLDITDKEFDIAANHLADMLKKFKVPEKEHQELIKKTGGLRHICHGSRGTEMTNYGVR